MNSTWRWLALASIAPVAWGSTYVVTAQTLPVDSPLWGAALRALPAGLVLLALARRRPRGAWWWRSLVLGALNVGAFFVLIYLAAHLLPSSIAAMLMALAPLTMLLLAWPLASERPALLSLTGAIIGFAGVALLVAGAAGPINPLGVAVSFAAMLMSSVGFVLARRWRDNTPALAVTAWQLTAGGLALLVAATLVEGPPPALDTAGILGATYLTLIATALAFATWFTALKHLPAGAVGLVGLLNPVAGAVLGALVVGEIITTTQLIGMGVILAGVLLGQQWGRRRAPRRALVSSAGIPGAPVVDPGTAPPRTPSRRRA